MSVGEATARVDAFLRTYERDVRQCKRRHPERADICGWRVMEGYYYE